MIVGISQFIAIKYLAFEAIKRCYTTVSTIKNVKSSYLFFVCCVFCSPGNLAIYLKVIIDVQLVCKTAKYSQQLPSQVAMVLHILELDMNEKTENNYLYVSFHIKSSNFSKVSMVTV